MKTTGHRTRSRPGTIGSYPVVQLQSVCTFLSGGTPAKDRPEFWNGDIPWVSAKDMKQPVLTDTIDHITPLALAESSTNLAPTGVVLVLVRGMGLAKGLPVCELARPCAFNQDIRALVPGSDLHPGYLAWAIRAAAVRILAKRDTVTHGTLKLDSNLLAATEIALPPLSEQERIAARLTEQLAVVDRARAAAQARLGAAETLSAAYLREVFEGPDASEWQAFTLRELLRTPVRTGTSKPGRPESDKKCLTLSSVRGRTLRLEASKPIDVSDAEAEGSWLQAGCFYVVRGNGNRDLVGRGAFAPDPVPTRVLFPDLLFQLDLDGRVDPSFFWCLWSSATVRRAIEDRARTAAGIYKINTANLNSLPLWMPPLVEQRRTGAVLSRRLSEAERVAGIVRDELATIEALPAATLREAFNGES